MHFIAAILAIALGVINLIFEKGNLRHRIFGWCWMVLMTIVTVPSFWIREINDGDLSWIHILSLWTIFSMAVALISIRKGHVEIHARFMIGTMIGAIIAGIFAMLPGRFISVVLGYA